MATFESFPIQIRPFRQTLHLMPTVKFGPPLPDGRQQRVQSAAPHWICKTSYLLTQSQNILEFRSYVTKMAGGAAEFIMPIHDRRNAPWPTGFNPESQKPTVTWSGGTNFTVSLNRQIIRVRAAAVGLAGQNTLSILHMSSGTLRRGHYFSIVDRTGRPRLYQIDEAIPGPISVDGQTYTISFQPPLRAAVAAKAVLDFDDPSCTMTLDAVDSGQVTVEGWAQTTADLTLRESFGGL